MTDSQRDAVDARWLGALQGLNDRAAHDLKGALNGVSLNLEVVCGRSESAGPAGPAGSSGAAVRPFAIAAREQLSEAIAMADALLSLGRKVREPVEMAPVVRRMQTLLASGARAEGKALEVLGPLDQLGATSADGNAVRFVIGQCLLAATGASARVRCEPEIDDDRPGIRIASGDGAPIPCDGDLIAAAAGAGIQIQAETSAISIRFPR